MNLYVVCISNSYIRDAQFLSTYGLSDEEFERCISNPSEYKDWVDISPIVYIGMVTAHSEEEARRIAGEKNDYDFRVLSAIEVNIEDMEK